MSDKIKSHHLGRKAILYVRQSSAHQVMHNQESRILQYAMRDRLCELGWREIEIIDDDLGRSAAGAVARAGFDRMVAEVCLGKVGGVAAREVSRFARNSRDWQQLIEMCRVVDTLLVDQEAVYAPRQGNDRLVDSNCSPLPSVQKRLFVLSGRSDRPSGGPDRTLSQNSLRLDGVKT
jgi:Resolvase, N terminal domain